MQRPHCVGSPHANRSEAVERIKGSCIREGRKRLCRQVGPPTSHRLPSLPFSSCPASSSPLFLLSTSFVVEFLSARCPRSRAETKLRGRVSLYIYAYIIPESGGRRRYSSGQCIRFHARKGITKATTRSDRYLRYPWNQEQGSETERFQITWKKEISYSLVPRFVFPLPFDKYLQLAVLYKYPRGWIDSCCTARETYVTFHAPFFFLFSLCFRERYGTKGFQELLAADNWMNVSSDRRSMG